MDPFNNLLPERQAWLCCAGSGERVLSAILLAYYRTYKAVMHSRDFKAIAEQVSAKNRPIFFDQWLYRPGTVLQAKREHANGMFIWDTSGSVLKHLQISVMPSRRWRSDHPAF